MLHRQEFMAEPSSPPPLNSPSLSIAPPPSSPPISPQMNSPPLSIAPIPPQSPHSQPTPPTMNSPSLSIALPLPSQPHSQPAIKFPNAKLLNKSDKTYAYINNLFMNNVVNIDPHATITSIHEFQISTPYGRACWDTFDKQIEITEAERGKANVVYGWYATPAEKVASTFFDGFKLLPNTLHPTIGAGIFLADLESPQYSGMQYQVNKDEEKHLILCSVVLGSMEKVFLECHQTNPSNEGYDTASNDPNDPNWYVVWADDINKRILPVCVVTCKTSAIQPPVKLKISLSRLTYASRVFLEIKKRIPIALIPPLEDIYDTFKKDRSISSFKMYKRRVHALLGDKKRDEIMMELYLLDL